MLVSAQRTDGTPLNPNVPEDGCAVAKEAVIAEIINTSGTVKRWFEGLNDIESDEYYREFESALKKLVPPETVTVGDYDASDMWVDIDIQKYAKRFEPREIY